MCLTYFTIGKIPSAVIFQPCTNGTSMGFEMHHDRMCVTKPPICSEKTAQTTNVNSVHGHGTCGYLICTQFPQEVFYLLGSIYISGRSCANSLIVAVLTAIPAILTALTHFLFKYLEQQVDCQ